MTTVKIEEFSWSIRNILITVSTGRFILRFCRRLNDNNSHTNIQFSLFWSIDKPLYQNCSHLWRSPDNYLQLSIWHRTKWCNLNFSFLFLPLEHRWLRYTLCACITAIMILRKIRERWKVVVSLNCGLLNHYSNICTFYNQFYLKQFLTLCFLNDSTKQANIYA